MTLTKFSNIEIAGLVAVVPAKKINSTEYAEQFGEENIKSFENLSGIKSVCRSISAQTPLDLGTEAAEILLDSYSIIKEEIGLLVMVSQKPDYRIPSSSHIIHKNLGLSSNCLCIDISLACSGFVIALQTTMSLLQHSSSKKALLITADTSHKTISPEDKSMIMLFGDSGSALLLEKKEGGSGIHQFSGKSDGKKFKSIITPAGGFRNPALPSEPFEWKDGVKRSFYHTQMVGLDVFTFSITQVPKLMAEFLEKTELSIQDFDYFTLHQANKYILEQIARKLKIPMGLIPISLDRYGNNSSNSIPLVLADHFGSINDNHSLHLLIAGFGAGLSWACGSISINKKNISPLYISKNKIYG